jgi:hypothetical protein
MMKNFMQKLFLTGCLTGFLGGCTHLSTRAAFDLQCPEDQVEIEHMSVFGSSYGARGCGRQASYNIDVYGEYLLNSPIQNISDDPAQTPSKDPKQENVPPLTKPTSRSRYSPGSNHR